MLPRFFKDMPPKKDLKNTGAWKLEVVAVFPIRNTIVHSEVYKGRLWVAYLRVRIRALLKDWETRGNDYGIGWRILKP